MALITNRDTIRERVPTWLRGTVLGGVLYSIATQVDALTEALTAGLKSRFPGYYSTDSLPLIGRERRIRRGRGGESDAIYAERLRRWLDDHRHRGGPYALLAQLHAHYAADPFEITLLYYPSALLGSGVARRYVLEADGTVTRDTAFWIPDDDVVRWARWWLIYQWPAGVVDDGEWGDAGTWGDGGTWGSNLSPAEVDDLRAVPREWNAAHCFGRVTLLTEAAELWGFPVGTWGDPGVWGGEQVTISV